MTVPLPMIFSISTPYGTFLDDRSDRSLSRGSFSTSHFLNAAGSCLTLADRATRLNPDRPNRRSPVMTPLGSWPANSNSVVLAVVMRQRAIAAVQQGYYITALAFFRQVLSYNAEAKDYNDRGCIYLKLGQLDAAIADFDRAIDLAPDQADAYLNRGIASMLTGAYRQALQDHSEALLLNPQNVRAWINRGIVLRHLGHYDLSIQCFDQALRLGSRVGYIYGERGRTHEQMGDWNCAHRDYLRSIEILEQDPHTIAQEAMIHQVQGWLTALLAQAA
jgi:tetratricopeptide (TPR) repeat protein